MRHDTYIIMVAAALPLALSACQEDGLSEKSVIAVESRTQNDFDRWLTANFVTPYNVEIQYRYEDNETDMNYYDVPAEYDASVKLAHIIKYTCVEAYDHVAGVTFTKTYFPKLFSFVGEFEYLNNGTMRLGTAEGGKKIRILGVRARWLDEGLADRSILDEYFLKTIHHEFVHILNQTRDYPVEFDQVTPTGYVSDDWSEETYVTGYLPRGFISAYAQKEGREDFAEMVSVYVMNSAEQWEALLAQARTRTGTDDDGVPTYDTTARRNIETKLAIAKRYYQETFGIDLDRLRDEVVRRENEVVDGEVDLDDLTVD